VQIVYTGFIVLATAVLWPALFIGTAIVFPNAIDPLLGGIQGALYVAAVIWLVAVCVVTSFVAVLLGRRPTRVLFFLTAVLGTLSAWSAYMAPMVIQAVRRNPPDGILGAFKIRDVREFVDGGIFVFVISLVTAALFISLRGPWAWRQR
jgi:hypothetical protein